MKLRNIRVVPHKMFDKRGVFCKRKRDPPCGAPYLSVRNASRRSTTGPVGALLCASPDVQREGQPTADCEFCFRAVRCPMLL